MSHTITVIEPVNATTIESVAHLAHEFYKHAQGQSDRDAQLIELCNGLSQSQAKLNGTHTAYLFPDQSMLITLTIPNNGIVKVQVFNA